MLYSSGNSNLDGDEIEDEDEDEEEHKNEEEKEQEGNDQDGTKGRDERGWSRTRGDGGGKRRGIFSERRDVDLAGLSHLSRSVAEGEDCCRGSPTRVNTD